MGTEKVHKKECLNTYGAWTWLKAELNERADSLKAPVNKRKLSMAEMTLKPRAFYARKYYKAEPKP